MAFGGWLGQTLEDVGQGAYGTVSRLGSAADDASRSLLGAVDDFTRFDYQGASDNMAGFEDAGNDAFGTGGWYKAAINMALTGQPFDPASDIIAKKIEGEQVNGKDFAKLATSQLPGVDTGYGKLADAAVSEGVRGAATAGLSGGSVASGFGQGVVQGGTMAGLGDYFNGLSNDGKLDIPAWNPDASSLPNYLDNGLGGAADNMPSFNTNAAPEASYFDQLKNNSWFKGAMGFLSGAHPLFGAVNKAMYGQPNQNRMPDTDNYAQTLRDIGIDPASVRGSGSSQPKTDPMIGLGQVLGSMYNTGKAQRRANEMEAQMGANRNAYQSQLEKSLLAQDAARGKRSQYGTRSVELQAKLAALDAQRMPGLMRLQEGQDQLNNRQLVNALEMYKYGKQPAMDAYDSLKGMFNGFGG
jgi:hypothetical protein